jgi:thioredoxin-like negative regulator of GroEL
LELSLGLVQADRKRFGEQARKIMVDIFHLLPPDSELATTYRRKLSTALY